MSSDGTNGNGNKHHSLSGWTADSRWSGITRLHSCSDALRLRGSIRIEYTPARHLSLMELWAVDFCVLWFLAARPDQHHPTPCFLRVRTTTRNSVRTYNDADEQLSLILWDGRSRFSAESTGPVSSPSLR